MPHLQLPHPQFKGREALLEESIRTVGRAGENWRDAKGRYHRADGPACIFSDGREEWWLHGERHRVGGPAVHRRCGWEEWWQDGVRHRLDGPAIMHPDGRHEWWTNGNHISEKIRGWMREHRIAPDWRLWTGYEKLMFKMWFA